MPQVFVVECTNCLSCEMVYRCKLHQRLCEGEQKRMMPVAAAHRKSDRVLYSQELIPPIDSRC
jgi:hypothetical protein